MHAALDGAVTGHHWRDASAPEPRRFIPAIPVGWVLEPRSATLPSRDGSAEIIASSERVPYEITSVSYADDQREALLERDGFIEHEFRPALVLGGLHGHSCRFSWVAEDGISVTQVMLVYAQAGWGYRLTTTLRSDQFAEQETSLPFLLATLWLEGAGGAPPAPGAEPRPEPAPTWHDRPAPSDPQLVGRDGFVGYVWLGGDDSVRGLVAATYQAAARYGGARFWSSTFSGDPEERAPVDRTLAEAPHLEGTAMRLGTLIAAGTGRYVFGDDYLCIELTEPDSLKWMEAVIEGYHDLGVHVTEWEHEDDEFGVPLPTAEVVLLSAKGIFRWKGPKSRRTILGTRRGTLQLTNQRLLFLSRARKGTGSLSIPLQELEHYAVVQHRVRSYLSIRFKNVDGEDEAYAFMNQICLPGGQAWADEITRARSAL